MRDPEGASAATDDRPDSIGKSAAQGTRAVSPGPAARRDVSVPDTCSLALTVLSPREVDSRSLVSNADYPQGSQYHEFIEEECNGYRFILLPGPA